MKINVEITGTSDLLMNNPQSMILEEQKKGKIVDKTALRDKKEEAENSAYRNEAGYLYVPNTAIKGSILNACSFRKIGKFSAKPIVAGGLRINPIEIDVLDLKGKKVKDYEIDLRGVVIQRARVIKARAKVKNWKLAFVVDINENLIAKDDTIYELLKDAGERVGILDFRPQKSGDFGCFKITKWEKAK